MLNLYVKLSIMKRLFLLLFAVTAFSSCTKHYMQLATLSSDSVFLDEGSYIYKDDNIAIDYLFSTDDGVFEFAVLNISDGDIYIDLEKSVFVYDKMVYDHFVRDISVTTYSEASSSYSNGLISYNGKRLYGDLSSESEGVAVTSTSKMPSTILIPKGSYRNFYGFDLNNNIYRQVFFARDPKKDEDVSLSRKDMNDPIDFSNIIYVICDNNEYSIRNDFEVSEIRNVLLTKNCQIDIAPNIYYTHYTTQTVVNGYYGYYFDDRSYNTTDLDY